MKKISLLGLLLSLNISHADVTGNLITNGTFDNGSTGWTLTGDAVRINDCCPGGHDLEFGDNGSIEQTFDLIDTHITQPMLDNGITLNSTVEVQNGECGVQGCWGGSGPADSFTVRLQILDENSNVLAVTTQERYDVTGIYGENFTDSVTYTGIGSNLGNIRISGSDSNSPANLGGANIDNISVTMTYDPTVLTAQETAIIATAFEEIEETLTTVSPEELFIYEEFIVEEFIPFEQPQIATEMFSEVFIQEVAVEEINTGIVNIFQEAIYEEQTTIETFPTEVESFEEVAESSEVENFSGSNERESGIESNENSIAGNSTEQSEVITRNESSEQIETSEQVSEESRNTELVRGNESESREDERTVSETARVGDSEQSLEQNDTETETSVSIDIADIEAQVSQRLTSVDAQLVATQTIIANAMTSQSVDSYATKNNNIFIQPSIDGGNIDDYIARDYSDARQLYASAQSPYQDTMVQRKEKIDEAVSNRIRAEEHLRRIRGY